MYYVLNVVGRIKDMIKEMNQTKAFKLLEKRESVFLNQVKDAINIANDMLPQI